MQLTRNTEYAHEAARSLGLQFELIDRHGGYLCEISSGRRRVYIAGRFVNAWPVNSASAHGLASDKPFCAQVLERHGVRTPRGSAVFLSDRLSALRAPGRELVDVPLLIKHLGWPVIAKPATGSGGELVRSCADVNEILAHLKCMSNRYDIGLVQEKIEGAEWRVVVFNGYVRWAYKKEKWFIMGNGHTTIRSLVDTTNTTLIARGMGPIEVESSGFRQELKRLGVGFDNILGEGCSIHPEPGGRFGEGGPDEITEAPLPSIAKAAVQAAEAVGLSIAGIDLIVTRNEVPFVLEVNGNTSVSAVEKRGRRDLALRLWRDVLIKIFDEKGAAYGT